MKKYIISLIISLMLVLSLPITALAGYEYIGTGSGISVSGNSVGSSEGGVLTYGSTLNESIVGYRMSWVNSKKGTLVDGYRPIDIRGVLPANNGNHIKRMMSSSASAITVTGYDLTISIGGTKNRNAFEIADLYRSGSINSFSFVDNSYSSSSSARVYYNDVIDLTGNVSSSNMKSMLTTGNKYEKVLSLIKYGDTKHGNLSTADTAIIIEPLLAAFFPTDSSGGRIRVQISASEAGVIAGVALNSFTTKFANASSGFLAGGVFICGTSFQKMFEIDTASDSLPCVSSSGVLSPTNNTPSSSIKITKYTNIRPDACITYSYGMNALTLGDNTNVTYSVSLRGKVDLVVTDFKLYSDSSYSSVVSSPVQGKQYYARVWFANNGTAGSNGYQIKFVCANADNGGIYNETLKSTDKILYGGGTSGTFDFTLSSGAAKAKVAVFISAGTGGDCSYNIASNSASGGGIETTYSNNFKRLSLTNPDIDLICDGVRLCDTSYNGVSDMMALQYNKTYYVQHHILNEYADAQTLWIYDTNVANQRKNITLSGGKGGWYLLYSGTSSNYLSIVPTDYATRTLYGYINLSSETWNNINTKSGSENDYTNNWSSATYKAKQPDVEITDVVICYNTKRREWKVDELTAERNGTLDSYISTYTIASGKYEYYCTDSFVGADNYKYCPYRIFYKVKNNSDLSQAVRTYTPNCSDSSSYFFADNIEAGKTKYIAAGYVWTQYGQVDWTKCRISLQSESLSNVVNKSGVESNYANNIATKSFYIDCPDLVISNIEIGDRPDKNSARFITDDFDIKANTTYYIFATVQNKSVYAYDTVFYINDTLQTSYIGGVTSKSVQNISGKTTLTRLCIGTYKTGAGYEPETLNCCVYDVDEKLDKHYREWDYANNKASRTINTNLDAAITDIIFKDSSGKEVESGEVTALYTYYVYYKVQNNGNRTIKITPYDYGIGAYNTVDQISPDVELAPGAYAIVPIGVYKPQASGTYTFYGSVFYHTYDDIAAGKPTDYGFTTKDVIRGVSQATNNYYHEDLFVKKAEVRIDIELIDPNADYRETTDVVTSVKIISSDIPLDLDPTDKAVLRLTVKDHNNNTIYTGTKQAIVPGGGNTNLVWFKWTVPDTIDDNTKVKVQADLLFYDNHPDDHPAKEFTGKHTDNGEYKTVPYIISVTPDTKYEARKPTSFATPATITELKGTDDAKGQTSWQIWSYDGSKSETERWTLNTYEFAVTATSELTPDSRATSSVYNTTGDVWTMKSGYGYEAEIDVTATKGQLNSGSLGTTEAQYAVMYVPEYNYNKNVNEYRTFEIIEATHDNETLQLPYYLTYGKRLHFTPLWYPDMQYAVKITLTDIWTPMGCMTLNMTPYMYINESMYSDYYIN